MLAKPIVNFSVLRDIHGLILKENCPPVVFGPFLIYHFSSHQQLISKKTTISPDHLWGNDALSYLIEVQVSARHSEKAIQKADILFEKFELTLKYAIGFSEDRFEVGVQNYRGWRTVRTYTISDDGAFSSSHGKQGAYQPLPIDDPYFTSVAIGFDRVWAAIGSTNNSELQRRLMLAIEWLGQAYSEISPASAFLKSAISLEILFTHNERSLINSSILSQISESIALLLGEDTRTRLEMESKVKALYSMRSAIAHAGKTEVAQEDLFEIFRVSRAAITKLMTNNALRDLSTIEAVHKHLKALKYSFPGV